MVAEGASNQFKWLLLPVISKQGKGFECRKSSGIS